MIKICTFTGLKTYKKLSNFSKNFRIQFFYPNEKKNTHGKSPNAPGTTQTQQIFLSSREYKFVLPRCPHLGQMFFFLSDFSCAKNNFSPKHIFVPGPMGRTFIVMIKKKIKKNRNIFRFRYFFLCLKSSEFCPPGRTFVLPGGQGRSGG